MVGTVKDKSNFFHSTLLIIYLFFLYQLVFSHAVRPFDGERPFNLVPVLDTVRTVTNSEDPVFHRFYEVVGNIFLLSPVGFFLGWRFHKISIIHFATFVVALSCAIELVQYFSWSWRTADINDVILNSLGAIFIFHLFKSRIPRRRHLS
jgi:glycopeptide antibiotics resistance protein